LGDRHADAVGGGEGKGLVLYTQAVSQARYEWGQGVDLFCLRSRHDDRERCWTLFDRCAVSVEVLGPVTPAEPARLWVVGEVAAPRDGGASSLALSRDAPVAAFAGGPTGW
jgi:hypothetical protein